MPDGRKYNDEGISEIYQSALEDYWTEARKENLEYIYKSVHNIIKSASEKLKYTGDPQKDIENLKITLNSLKNELDSPIARAEESPPRLDKEKAKKVLSQHIEKVKEYIRSSHIVEEAKDVIINHLEYEKMQMNDLEKFEEALHKVDILISRISASDKQEENRITEETHEEEKPVPFQESYDRIYKEVSGIEIDDVEKEILITLSEKPINSRELKRTMSKKFKKNETRKRVLDLERKGLITSEEKDNRKIYSSTIKGKLKLVQIEYGQNAKEVIEYLSVVGQISKDNIFGISISDDMIDYLARIGLVEKTEENCYRLKKVSSCL